MVFACTKMKPVLALNECRRGPRCIQHEVDDIKLDFMVAGMACLTGVDYDHEACAGQNTTLGYSLRYSVRGRKSVPHSHPYKTFREEVLYEDGQVSSRVVS